MTEKRKRELTPEQKAKKASRQRELYTFARRLGLSTDQARNVRRTLTSGSLTDEVKDALKQFIEPNSKRRKSRTSPGAGSTKKSRTSSGTKRSKSSIQKGLRTKQANKFKTFVENHPELNAKQALKAFQDQGGKLGQKKAAELFRNVRGIEKNRSKITKIKYYTNEEKPIFGEGNKHLIKDNYMYLMQFEIEQQDANDTHTDWIYIATSEKKTMKWLINETLDMWADGAMSGNEKYKAIRIIPESIQLIHAVDTTI